ncbi:MAG: hypothetical protein QOE65_1461 [Solirubrobacteraceae bacterium]|jgi:hypothetical protein|nr:hypothetical protein [Solirubrobacteraceae bacterium]
MNRRTLRAAAPLVAAGTLAYFAPVAGAAGDPERDPTAGGIAYHVYPSLARSQIGSMLAANQETPGDIEVVTKSPLRFAVVGYASSSDPASRWYNRTRRLFYSHGSLASLKSLVTQAGQRIIDLERVYASGIRWVAVTVPSGFLAWDAFSGTPTNTLASLRAANLTPIDIDRGTVVGLTSDPGLAAVPQTDWHIGVSRTFIEKRLYELRARQASLVDIERNSSAGYDILIAYDRPNSLLVYSDTTQRAPIRRMVFIGSLAGLRHRVKGGNLRVLDLEASDVGKSTERWMAILTRN